MAFNATTFTFRLSRADNGVIFEEYQPSSDEMKRLVAMDRQHLLSMFDEWAAEKRLILERVAREFLRVQEPA